MLSTALTLLPLALSVVGVAAEPRSRMVHRGVARHAQGNLRLVKRYSTARWSFYDVGLGACGKTNVASDYIVALNADQFGSGYPGPNCFKKIQMSYNGKTATATIADSCPGCPYGGLDLSRGLFTHFASEDIGIIYGEWRFVDEGTPAAAVTTKVAQAVLTTKAQPTTTQSTQVWQAPTTTTKARIVTTTKQPVVVPTTTTEKAATNTWIPAVPAAQELMTSTRAAVGTPATTSTRRHSKTSSSSSPVAITSSTDTLGASLAAASSSATSLASSFTVILPSASASTSANGTDTIQQIQTNLDALNILLTHLGKLIMSATLNN